MVEIIEIEQRTATGVTRAAIVPEWGANVVRFGYRQVSWASEVSALETVGLETMARNPTSFGMPLLAPTPGRVGRNQSGRFRYHGREYEIEPTRHGLVRQVPWRVTEVSKSLVRCETEIRPAGGRDRAGQFPFHFRASHEVSIEERLLRSRVDLVNLGGEVQPLNIGWHPYLRRPPGRCTVQIPAKRRWVLADEVEPTPTGEVEAPVAGPFFFAGHSLGDDEHWDDVFTALDAAHGIATCWIESEESIALEAGGEQPVTARRIVEVPAGTGESGVQPVPHVQFYTPPGRQAISIEPLSSIPDAINLAGRGVEGTGLREVGPGGRASFEISLRLEVDS
ncbi:MAG: aldose 1-epimerase [Acidobacteriota bacterium]|nr:aldose 1-epimerase [Acidobacteriota bacterium]